MAEIGLAWNHLPPTQQWYERIRNEFRLTRQKFAYNSSEPELTSPRQHGGVGIVATGLISHRIDATGSDDPLGRWSWFRIATHQQTVRVISAYRPVESGGPEAVATQHRRYFRQKGISGSPRDLFLQHLKEAILVWIDEGDLIVLGMDANSQINSQEMLRFAEDTNMKEIVTSTHPTRISQATCNKGTSNKPIDGIWVSSSLTAQAAGYLPFSVGIPSDH